MKEATRSSAKSGSVTNGRGQPQDVSGPTIPPPTMMTGTSPYSARHGVSPGGGGQDEDHRNSNEANANNSTLLKGVAHQRSQSLTAVAPGGGGGNATTESPKHGVTAGGGGKPDLIGQSPETQLKYENERLRLALAQR